jgi:nucleotide-binding universal stress UspA family protein
MMDRTVLVTLDGSTLSESILKYVPAIVRPNDIVVLLQVLAYPEGRRRSTTGFEQPFFAGTSVAVIEPITPAYVEQSEQAIDSSRKEALDYLFDRSLILRNEGLTVKCEVVFDDNPAKGIVDFARELGPLFVAMATHGRGGLDHALHGSICETVVRSGVAPVMVMRP